MHPARTPRALSAKNSKVSKSQLSALNALNLLTNLTPISFFQANRKHNAYNIRCCPLLHWYLSHHLSERVYFSFVVSWLRLFHLALCSSWQHVEIKIPTELFNFFYCCKLIEIVTIQHTVILSCLRQRGRSGVEWILDEHTPILMFENRCVFSSPFFGSEREDGMKSRVLLIYLKYPFSDFPVSIVGLFSTRWSQFNMTSRKREERVLFPIFTAPPPFPPKIDRCALKSCKQQKSNIHYLISSLSLKYLSK